MINESRGGFGRMLATTVLALILTVVPLPADIGWLRPDWLLIVVIYWSLVSPRLAGLAFAWFGGLLIDVTTGAVLGEHAMAFLVVSFLTHREQLRMRIFPVWQQAFWVFVLLVLYQFVLFWIDGITGQAVTTWRRWMPAVIGAVLWPVVIAVMDTLNRRTASR
jgi:rod shape-determining protein MreD